MSLPFKLRGGRAAPGRFSKLPLFKDTNLEGHCRWHARARTRRLTGSLRRLPGPRPQAGQQPNVGMLLASRFLWGDFWFVRDTRRGLRCGRALSRRIKLAQFGDQPRGASGQGTWIVYY